ncbi:ROK family transcriptional regulator [Devosia sp.]|uniref:ROK family transcriptional regulator n=1 Tax=Devosia sp. TaxID=1871048 RepID=UPI003A935053
MEPDFFETAGLGVQPAGVRQTNIRAVLTLIATSSGLSAAELARLTHLAPQTISAILEDIDKLGLLRKGEVRRGRRGQPATPYHINPRGAFAIGIELGWRRIEARLVNIGGETLSAYRRDYSYPDPHSIFDEIGRIATQFRNELGEDDRDKLVGFGIAAPGNIGRNIGILDADLSVGKRWLELDIAEAAEAATGMRVQVFNDGNAACWAEFVSMPAPRSSDFAYLMLGTFIAAGVVVEGKLWEGPTGNSANLGAMLINDRHGDVNFAHLVASTFALSQRLAGAGIDVPATSPLDWPWEDWEPYVSDWIDDSASALASIIANTAAVFEFRTAVLDGVMPEPLLERLVEAVERYLSLLPSMAIDIPKLTRGRLGPSAASTGAAYLPLYQRFFSRDFSARKLKSTAGTN